MKKRDFIKRGLIWIPTISIFVPKLLLADRRALLQAANVAAPATGCTTSQVGNTAANNGSTSVTATTNLYYATQFTAPNTVTACKLNLYLDKNGSPTYDIYGSIWDDDTSEPGSSLGESAALDASTLGASEAAVSFSLSVSITASTVYWAVIRASTNGDVSNHVRWYRNSAAPLTIKRSVDGLTWTNETTARSGKFEVFSA